MIKKKKPTLFKPHKNVLFTKIQYTFTIISY